MPTKPNQTSSPRHFGRRLAATGTAASPAGFKEPPKGAIVCLDRGSSGKRRVD
jgi:hypothetical protein